MKSIDEVKNILPNQVLVRTTNPEPSVTESGIKIVKKGRPAPDRGRVVKVGEGVEGLAQGDLVFFSKFKGSELKVNKKLYFFLDKKHILGKHEE